MRQAREFSEEVGNADDAVKQAFFSLSGKALEFLLKKYGEKYGNEKEQYARQTIPKWKAGTVQMSGMVAKRLFELLPPFMPPEQKNKIVEAIWQRYGPHSRKYVYLGPDSSPDAVIGDIEAYFNNVNVVYPIPDALKRRFDWLSDNDAVAKERLLNHFMDRQRHAAILNARINIPMLLVSMKADEEGRISKLNHTVFVGNHKVEIKADWLRSGFLFSNSANDFVKPPRSFKVPTFLGIAAAVIVGVFVLNRFAHGTAASTSSQFIPDSPHQAQPLSQTQPSFRPVSLPTAAPIAAQPVVSHAPVLSRPAPVVTASNPPSVRVSDAALVTSAVGCADLQIAYVNGDGSEVVLSNGKKFNVSGGVMRLTAAGWGTGDKVHACSSSTDTSLRVGYASVQATAGGSASVEAGGCRAFFIGFSAADGSEVGTTDGSVFQLVDNGVSKLTASSWTTGQTATVCSMRLDGVWYASVGVGYAKVETTFDKAGSGEAKEPACTQDTVTSGPTESGTIRLDDGSYRIANGVMQLEAKAMAVGDTVTVCKYTAAGLTYASIAKAYNRVQATRVQ